ncbi:hypothetical protein CSUB01_03415 [Colletotrichum sublineola]|uniref:Uncharacterized protein n=1 Tax=Colletotrichum sublineola TaxID=1173701 RepID=A0A066XHW1_COLSU|nr:hypothetical protein CSUB01_03415 [Colletotrichum sublineola]
MKSAACATLYSYGHPSNRSPRCLVPDPAFEIKKAAVYKRRDLSPWGPGFLLVPNHARRVSHRPPEHRMPRQYLHRLTTSFGEKKRKKKENFLAFLRCVAAGNGPSLDAPSLESLSLRLSNLLAVSRSSSLGTGSKWPLIPSRNRSPSSSPFLRKSLAISTAKRRNVSIDNHTAVVRGVGTLTALADLTLLFQTLLKQFPNEIDIVHVRHIPDKIVLDHAMFVPREDVGLEQKIAAEHNVDGKAAGHVKVAENAPFHAPESPIHSTHDPRRRASRPVGELDPLAIDHAPVDTHSMEGRKAFGDQHGIGPRGRECQGSGVVYEALKAT